MPQRRPPTVAIIADIHGNIPALDATLADLERIQPDRVVIAGDIVNRGPQSHAAADKVAALGLETISGNHDTWLVNLARGEHIPDEWDTSWWTPVRMAVQELTPANLDWLDRLPFSLSVTLPGTEPLLVVHGSPRHSREGMGRMVGDEQLAEALAGVEERTIVGAHIHYPWERWLGDQHVVVIGAAGCPFNGDINAQYGLFTWDEGLWRFEHRSVPYDHEPLYEAWHASRYLDNGSLASELMLLEHKTARTQYVPFWEWTQEHGLPLSHTSLVRFNKERPIYPPPPWPLNITPPPSLARRAPMAE